MTEALLFEVPTPLGFSVRCTRAYWEFIVTYKHPVLRDRERELEEVLADPDEARRSRKDPSVLLFYRPKKSHFLTGRSILGRGPAQNAAATASFADSCSSRAITWV